jgi:hypothetical protein
MGGGCVYCGTASKSGLESIVGNYNRGSSYNCGHSANDASYMKAADSFMQPAKSSAYDLNPIKKEVYADKDRGIKRVSETYSSSMDDFLNPQRTKTVFIGSAAEVKEFVEDAFFKLTGREFPDDIAVRIVDADEMKKMHPSSVLGFALNRKHLGQISEIFIKKDMLDRIMLTIGHELGHVLTRRLNNNRDEEAKAFAFSMAWMKVIKENNIANLSTAIKLDAPARNGLHDVALDFVLKLIQKGREALDIYTDLIRGTIGVDENGWN